MTLLGTAIAQEPAPFLLDNVNVNGSGLRVPDSPYITRARYTTINPQSLTASATPGTQVVLNLFDDATFIATTVHVEPRQGGRPGYIWYGEIPLMAGISAVMVVDDTQVTGSFYTPQGLYSLERDASGWYIVAQVAPWQPPDGTTDEVIPPQPPPDYQPEVYVPEAFADPSVSTRYVDVMILYTPAARDHLTGMPSAVQRAELMVANANVARLNSGVNNYLLRLVHVAVLAGYKERPSLQGDLDAVTYNSKANQLRDQYGADLVAFITADRQKTYCGFGWLLLDMDNIGWRQRYGYSVTSVYCTTGNTFAHETGHNLGGSHDHANLGNYDALTSYSHGYQDPQGIFNTVMAYSFNGSCKPYCAPFNIFSTPKVRLFDRPVGRANWADMARLLRLTSPFVADFRPTRVPVATLPSFDLIAPVPDALVTMPYPVFSWQAVPGATTYEIIINGTDTGFRYRGYVQQTACQSDVCHWDTSAVGSNNPAWKPPASDGLRWRVRAFNNVYQNTSQTPFRNLTLELLPRLFPLSLPVADAIITDPQMTFALPDDHRVSEWRFTLLNPNGDRAYRSAWLSRDVICAAGTCTLNLNLTALNKPVIENGRYTWMVHARRSDANGTTRSQRRHFTIDLLPATITQDSPAPADIVTSRQPVFTWFPDPILTQYRFVYRKGDQRLRTRWLNALDVCSPTLCSLDLSAQSLRLPLRDGAWQILGRRGNVKGVTKSPWRDLTINKP